jgi:hypothetical protein
MISNDDPAVIATYVKSKIVKETMLADLDGIIVSHNVNQRVIELCAGRKSNGVIFTRYLFFWLSRSVSEE